MQGQLFLYVQRVCRGQEARLTICNTHFWSSEGSYPDLWQAEEENVWEQMCMQTGRSVCVGKSVSKLYLSYIFSLSRLYMHFWVGFYHADH